MKPLELMFLDWDGVARKCGEDSVLPKIREERKDLYQVCLSCGVVVEKGICLSCKQNEVETKSMVSIPSFEIPIPEEKEYTVNLIGEE